MKCPPAIEGEQRRLEALAEYGLTADRPLASLDPVVQIAARAFGMPVAAVNMIGSNEVFFAAAAGLKGSGADMRRDVSFCAHAIAQGEVLVVPDTTLDERFHDNPLVTGAAQFRFYAGVALLSASGAPIGALCVIDHKPRHDFTVDDGLHLRELAKMATDRLELRRVERAAAREMRTFDTYARNSPTAVAWFDSRRTVISWNASAASLFGYEIDEGRGRLIEALVSEPDRDTVCALIERAIRARSVDGLEMPERIHGVRKDGSQFLLGVSMFCWDDAGDLVFNVHLQDVTARSLRREELYRLARTDGLTGLANRSGFYRRMEESMRDAAEVAILLLDIDSFKDVNDVLGQQAGDMVLCEVAQRLRQALQGGGTAARVGCDEFAILLPNVGRTADAEQFGHRVVAALSAPIGVAGQEVRLTACCGVAVAPEDAREALELVGNADLALMKAKRRGRGQVVAFVPALRSAAAARRMHAIELHRAVSDGEFVLFYQPQMRLRDNALVGAEALIRWEHPQQGLLSPAAFLPGLEGSPLAAAVGSWVLDEACAQTAFWHRHGAPDLRIGVNLFSVQLHVNDLVGEVLSVLDRHGLPPKALEIEVTENIVLDDERVVDVLRRLRAEGVGITFDDFGTGYASLSLLRKYPLDRLKIDRSFVQHMHESESDASVVRAIIEMARGFGLKTTAEGVERHTQRALLRAIGCDEGQGYLFGKPLPANAFAEKFGFGALRRVAGGL